jgi:hypothetical protein
MLVVAPASEISRLDWLTNAEDDARDEAASLAETTAKASTFLVGVESDRGHPTELHC